MAEQTKPRGEDAVSALAEAAARRGMPSTAALQLTTYCNFRCAHCYQVHSPTRASAGELSLAEIERVLGELADCGVLLLTLTGGELFTRRDALEVVEIAHRLGFFIRLKTTGHFVDERKADALAAARPLQVDISLYGPTPAIHETITRVTGSWERALSAARLLIEREVVVTLATPIMDSNAADCGATAELARQLGAQWTADPIISPITDGDLAPAALRASWDTLRRFYAGKFAAGIRDGLVSTYADRDLDPDRTLQALPCGAASNVVGISPTGQVLPCNMMPLSAGDLRRHSFRRIWAESELLRQLRNLLFADLSECNVCELRPYCRRCHTIALAEHGSYAGASLEACRHAVMVRDFLREFGKIPASETALPPTWDRVDLDGHHQRCPERCSCRCG